MKKKINNYLLLSLVLPIIGVLTLTATTLYHLNNENKNSNNQLRLIQNLSITKDIRNSTAELTVIIKNRQKENNNLQLFIILSTIISLMLITYNHLSFQTNHQKFIDSILLSNEELKTISQTDSLTSLYNRRHFDAIFEKRITVSRRNEDNLTFVLCDIDYFKQYNDTYGHQAGDLVLQKVAAQLHGDLSRKSDYAFRIGGEEFGLLYNTSSLANSIDFANRIRKNVENLVIEHSGNTVSDYVTISMGLVFVEYKDSKSKTPDEIYALADEALYESKQTGRNKLTSVTTKKESYLGESDFCNLTS